MKPRKADLQRVVKNMATDVKKLIAEGKVVRPERSNRWQQLGNAIGGLFGGIRKFFGFGREAERKRAHGGTNNRLHTIAVKAVPANG